MRGALLERGGEIDEEGTGIASVFEGYGAPCDGVDGEEVGQVELDAGAVLEHAEADFVAARDGLCDWIDAHVEMVVEEIVVGAVRSVGSAEDLCAGGRSWGRAGVFCALGAGLVVEVVELAAFGGVVWASRGAANRTAIGRRREARMGSFYRAAGAALLLLSRSQQCRAILSQALLQEHDTRHAGPQVATSSRRDARTAHRRFVRGVHARDDC